MEDDEVVAAAQLRDRVLEVGRVDRHPALRRPGSPATMQTSGSVACSGGRAGEHQRLQDLRRLGLGAQVLVQARRARRARARRPGSAPRGRTRAARCASPRAAAALARPVEAARRPVAGAGDQHRRRRRSCSSSAPKASRSLRRRVPAAHRVAGAGRGSRPSALHICSGAEMPSRPRAPAIVRLVSRQRARRERLHPLPLGADHLAVAVEGVEVGGDRGRVGADPVRRAPLGRLADLVGELEQALDQRLLRRLERRARGRRAGRGGGVGAPPPRPCAGCWRSARARTGRSRPGCRSTRGGRARGRGRRSCRGCARA